MQILIVAATPFEIAPLTSHFGEQKPFDVLITGVGMVATAFAMGSATGIKKYDLLINLGIAGSFDRDINLGQVVEITEDCFAELGAEDDIDFIPIETLGFGQSCYFPGARLSALLSADNIAATLNIRQGKGITVNKVHGNGPSIAAITRRLNPQLESMEGAAFFYAAKQLGIPAIQIRAVSNYVEKRNRDAWQIGSAIKNLNNFAIQLIGIFMQTGAQ